MTELPPLFPFRSPEFWILLSLDCQQLPLQFPEALQSDLGKPSFFDRSSDHAALAQSHAGSRRTRIALHRNLNNVLEHALQPNAGIP